MQDDQTYMLKVIIIEICFLEAKFIEKVICIFKEMQNIDHDHIKILNFILLAVKHCTL